MEFLNRECVMILVYFKETIFLYNYYDVLNSSWHNDMMLHFVDIYLSIYFQFLQFSYCIFFLWNQQNFPQFFIIFKPLKDLWMMGTIL